MVTTAILRRTPLPTGCQKMYPQDELMVPFLFKKNDFSFFKHLVSTNSNEHQNRIVCLQCVCVRILVKYWGVSFVVLRNVNIIIKKSA